MEKEEQQNRWVYFFLVASGVLLSTMDSSMVNVALPEITRHFEVSLYEVKFVVLSYLLIITCTLVFWGRFADQHGKGKIYLIGMIVFMSGAALCSLAIGFYLLVVARCIQALGASMIMSSGPAILRQTCPKEHLGKTLGLLGIATSFGLMSGPLVSGLILEYYSWRGVFLISLPIGLAVCVIGRSYLVTIGHETSRKNSKKNDLPGGILWVLLVAVYVALINWKSTSAVSLALIVSVFMILLGLFVKVEMKSSDPILPIFLVRKRFYWIGVATAAMSFASLFIPLILIPFYLDYILLYPASKVGMVMMSLPVSLVVISPFSGWLYDRFGNARVISTIGLLVSLTAIIFLRQLEAGSSAVSICLSLTLLGAGQSIFLSPNSASILKKVEDRYAGITSGILATARNFGMLTGAGLAGSWFSVMFYRYSNGYTLQQYSIELQEAFIHAQKDTLTIAMTLLVVACCISGLRNE